MLMSDSVLFISTSFEWLKCRTHYCTAHQIQECMWLSPKRIQIQKEKKKSKHTFVHLLETQCNQHHTNKVMYIVDMNNVLYIKIQNECWIKFMAFGKCHAHILSQLLGNCTQHLNNSCSLVASLLLCWFFLFFYYVPSSIFDCIS